MSILNVYVKKGGKKTWIEMDTFTLIYTSLPTKSKSSLPSNLTYTFKMLIIGLS